MYTLHDGGRPKYSSQRRVPRRVSVHEDLWRAEGVIYLAIAQYDRARLMQGSTLIAYRMSQGPHSSLSTAQ